MKKDLSMHSKRFSITFFLFLFTYRAQGYQYQELTSSAANLFELEANTWQVIGKSPSSNNTSVCGSYPLLGGFSVLKSQGYLERKYSSLPDHDILYFQMRFFIIDDWQEGESIVIEFDGQRITFGSQYLYLAKYAVLTSLCGSSIHDLPWFTFVGQVPHSDSNLTLRITSNTTTTPDVAFFGVRNVSLTFAKTNTISTQKSCFHVKDNNVYGVSSLGECNCKRGQYKDYLSVCQSCHSNCLECFGPSAKECSTCKSGYSFTDLGCIQCHSSCETCSGGNSDECLTCISGLWFHPENRTCQSFCNYPSWGQEVIDNLKICRFPCQNNQYLALNGSCLDYCPEPTLPTAFERGYVCESCVVSSFFSSWNQTCQTSCDPPLVQEVQGNFSLCKYPCQNNEFLAWNFSCLASCNLPLIQTTYSGLKYCHFPCGSQQVLYEDGSCSDYCNFPFRLETRDDLSFCVSICLPNQIVNWNGSCISECASPFILKQEGQVKVCHSPCSNPSDYYYDVEELCKPICNFPSVLNDTGSLKICSSLGKQKITEEEKEEIREVVQTISTTGKIASIGATTVSIASSANPNSLSLGSLVKMLHYIRYMEIYYPPKLQLMLESQDSSSISFNFAPEIPKEVEEMFPKYRLPYRFDKYNLHSNFLVNFWEGLVTVFIIILIITISATLMRFTQSTKYVYPILKWVHGITKWDLFLLVFCSNYDGLAFFGSLQLRTFDSNSFLSIMGSIICVIMNFIGIYILYKTVYIIIKLRRARYKIGQIGNLISPLSTVKITFRSCQILFKGFKDRLFLQQAFMFFYLARLYIFDIIIGYLFEYPLAQSVLIVIINFLMILYLMIFQPFKEISNLIEFLINETILVIVNVNVLILAFLDSYELEAPDTRITTGDIIIKANVIFNILALVFIALEVVIGFFKVYRVLKTSQDKSISGLLRKLLLIFMEKDGMEIEDNIEDHIKDFSPKTNNIPRRNKNLSVQTNFLKINNELSSPHFNPESNSASLSQIFMRNKQCFKSKNNNSEILEPSTSEISPFHKSSDFKSRFSVAPQEGSPTLISNSMNIKYGNASFSHISMTNREIESYSYNNAPPEESPKPLMHSEFRRRNQNRLSLAYKFHMQNETDLIQKDSPRLSSVRRASRSHHRNCTFYNESLSSKQDVNFKEKQATLSTIFGGIITKKDEIN